MELKTVDINRILIGVVFGILLKTIFSYNWTEQMHCSRKEHMHCSSEKKH